MLLLPANAANVKKFAGQFAYAFGRGRLNGVAG
jgi:hypothetical protein